MKYHISEDGTPRPCTASQRPCPLGFTPDEHFESAEEAREFYESQMVEDTFAPAVKRKKSLFSKTDLAKSSDREDLEEAISARRITRKTAAALAANPNTPTDILLKARASVGYPVYNEYVAMEMHPNYPRSELSSEGANHLLKITPEEDLPQLFASDNFGDKLLDQGVFLERPDLNKAAVSNGNNGLSEESRNWMALKHKNYAVAAAESGKWPTQDVLSGKIMSYSSVSHATTRTPDELIVKAVAHTPSDTIARGILEHYQNEENEIMALSNVLDNERLSPELKAEATERLNVFKERLPRLPDVSKR